MSRDMVICKKGTKAPTDPTNKIDDSRKGRGEKEANKNKKLDNIQENT